MKPNRRKLQALIDNAVRAHNSVHKADAALYQYCNKVWEYDELDDSIIDGCLGGCGHSMGMDADKFIETMNAQNPPN